MPRTSRDLTGEKFGGLIVLRPAESRLDKCGNPRRWWVCRCVVCEEVVEKSAGNLAQRNKSCGCYHGSAAHRANMGAARRKHGHNVVNSGTYRSWMAMRHRCRCTEHKVCITHYVDRGITIDPRWDDFAVFLADMGERPEGRYSIDRINPDDGYHPGNCRWADVLTQARNRKTTITLTREGRSQTLMEWAAELGISRSTIHVRIKRGWTEEQALSPVRGHGFRRPA